MANRRSSDSRRNQSPPSPVGAGESARSTAAGAAAAGSQTQTAASQPRPRRSAAAEPPRAPAAREPAVSPETRRVMISEAAYLRAERRGFAPGREEEDWLTAEKEVDALLSAGQGGPQ